MNTGPGSSLYKIMLTLFEEMFTENADIQQTMDIDQLQFCFYQVPFGTFRKFLISKQEKINIAQLQQLNVFLGKQEKDNIKITKQ